MTTMAPRISTPRLEVMRLASSSLTQPHRPEVGEPAVVLFTGSRLLHDRWLPGASMLVNNTLDKTYSYFMGRMRLRHGAAKGADALADAWGRGKAGVVLERRPAQWKLHGKAAGVRRNIEMINEQPRPHVCVAMVVNDSSGARQCAAYAQQAGIEVWLYRITADITNGVEPELMEGL